MVNWCCTDMFALEQLRVTRGQLQQDHRPLLLKRGILAGTNQALVHETLESYKL